jgi:prepilin-type N-terminal cleavage/methylation domain-containing protein
MKSKKAFTLIELLVVVLIIGILAVIAVPQYQVSVLKSRFAGVILNTNNYKKALEEAYLINGQYPSYNQVKNFFEIQGYREDTGVLYSPDEYIRYNFCRSCYSVSGCIFTDSSKLICYEINLDRKETNAGKKSCSYSNDTAEKVCKSFGF